MSESLRRVSSELAGPRGAPKPARTRRLPSLAEPALPLRSGKRLQGFAIEPLIELASREVNVLERRRELGLLRAVGYDRRRMTTMIVAESMFLLGAGLLAGVGCAAIAIAPAWLGRGGSLPGPGLVVLLAAVAVAGILSSAIATRAAIRGRMLDALRAE